MRKLISFDDETYASLVDLGRSRMATLQEIADEAFADVLKKHGVPVDLRDALRKSVKAAGLPANRRKTASQMSAGKPTRARVAKRKADSKAKRKAG